MWTLHSLSTTASPFTLIVLSWWHKSHWQRSQNLGKYHQNYLHGWIPLEKRWQKKYVYLCFGWADMSCSFHCAPVFQWINCLAHYTECKVLPMFEENKTFPWRADSTQQTMLVVTHRLCRSGYVDWRVQRRALSTTPLKTVHKYCRVTLCLSAALNLPSLTRQLCLGNVLPSTHPDRPHISWCIVVNV